MHLLYNLPTIKFHQKYFYAFRQNKGYGLDTVTKMVAKVLPVIQSMKTCLVAELG